MPPANKELGARGYPAKTGGCVEGALSPNNSIFFACLRGKARRALPGEGALSPNNSIFFACLRGKARRALPGEGALSPNNCAAARAGCAISMG